MGKKIGAKKIDKQLERKNERERNDEQMQSFMF